MDGTGRKGPLDGYACAEGGVRFNRNRDLKDVGVSVDNNGNLQAYVKRVADERAAQKVQGGLADYTDNMRQQGFGQIQTNYMAEKG